MGEIICRLYDLQGAVQFVKPASKIAHQSKVESRKGIRDCEEGKVPYGPSNT